jgi:ribosome biogenesis GTPase
VAEADWEDFETDERVRSVGAKLKKSAVEVTRKGQVVAIEPRGCEVKADEEIVKCRPKEGLAAGDFVQFDELRRIRDVLPRRTTLSRPDPMNPRIERVIAANVDVVVMVASVRKPELRPGLIDRYLIAIEKGGADALLCVTKCDLAQSPEDFAPIAPYRELGISVCAVSKRTGEGLEELRVALTGKLVVLVGHSGVGKSSLLNILVPEARAKTGAISEAYGKGTHTTRGSRLYEHEGVRIIDTPGVREFGLWRITAEEVLRSFREFEPFADACQFANCTHTHEPDCGVKAALEGGLVSAARYAAYCRLLGTL